MFKKSSLKRIIVLVIIIFLFIIIFNLASEYITNSKLTIGSFNEQEQEKEEDGIGVVSELDSRDFMNPLPKPYAFSPRISSDDYLASNPRFSLDEQGVLIMDYGDMWGGLGAWHNPLFIAVYANALWREFLDGDYESKQKFLHQVNWLVENYIERNDMVVWEYPFSVVATGMDPGWISGLTQGVLLSVLVRAHAVTGDQSYLNLADRVFVVFERLVSEGGVQTPVSTRGGFYEEAAQTGKPSNQVLNGHIGALVGLWDYYLYTGEERVLEAFNWGVNGAKETLSQFDAGGTSYYMLNPLRIAPVGGYNRQHVSQLLWLYHITEDPFFLQYALSFNAYEFSPYIIREVRGATNSKTHGMENLYLRYGRVGHTYWSHNEFPTWVELDLGEPKVIAGLTLFSGELERARPKDYDIEFSLDGENWKNMIKIRNNTKRYAHHVIPEIYTQYIRITIHADNGNKNVVLIGFGVDITSEFRDPVAVVDWDYFIGSGNPSVVVDSNPQTAWTSRDGGGWIIIDLHKKKNILNLMVHSGNSNGLYIAEEFTILISDDLLTWQEIAYIYDNDQAVVRVDFINGATTARYIKMDLKSIGKTTITEIIINNDTKEMLSSLQEIFDTLDYEVNEGRGYSEYLNSEGLSTGALLAWSESYLMQGYINMYKATKDIKYLDSLYSHIESILDNRDDKIGLRDYKNELVPAWGTNRHTRDNAWMHFVVHTGMITYPMLEFVELVNEDNIKKYLVASNKILKQVKESIKYHNKDWRNNHYVYPDDFYKKDYIVPISQQAAMGRSLILLYKLTNKDEYLNQVESLAKFIKDKAIKEDEISGRYFLKQSFIPGKTVPEEKIVDISHATITIHFIYLAHKNNIIFTEKDMYKFTNTISHLAENNNNRFPMYLDGSGDFNYEVAAGQYVFLSEFDGKICDSVADLFFNHLKINRTAKYMQEDWWGTIMLGLSRLINCQNE